MITVRKSRDRGAANHGWLDTRHTFSFAEYFDPDHTQFRSLRVMNEDRVAPSNGFPTHPHKDMEIITYVIEGSLEHKDDMGNGSVIHAGSFQKMSAGTGVLHSEFNPSENTPVHFYQIWIQPSEHGLTPSYHELEAAKHLVRNRWNLVLSPDGGPDTLPIAQDAYMYQTRLSTGGKLDYTFPPDRYGWLQIISGDLTVEDERLVSGDGASFEDAGTLSFVANEDTEALLFDLA